MAAPGLGQERGEPLDLHLGRHVLPLLPRPHGSDVDDVGAVRDHGVEAGEGVVEVAMPGPE